MVNDQVLADLALRFFADGVLQIDTKLGFKLKWHEQNPRAPLSPIYLRICTPENPKPGPLSQETLNYVGQLLWQKAKKEQLFFHAVAGLPNAGTPIAEAFARAALVDGKVFPVIVLEKMTAGTGTRTVSRILDDKGVPRSSVVLMIDDLITGGDTKDEGVETLSSAGYRVNDVLVVVDRQQGGAEYLKKRGMQLWYLLTLPEIINLLAKEGKITKEEQFVILQYLGTQI